MGLAISISPHGRLFTEAAQEEDQSTIVHEPLAKRIAPAFARGSAEGLLHLATHELQAHLPPAFVYARDFGTAYLTQLCHTPDVAEQSEVPNLPPPSSDELISLAATAPP